MKVSVAEAKNKLTQLIHQVEKGERVTICRHGLPIVDLVRTGAVERKARRFGTLRGKIKILDCTWAKPQNDLEAWLREATFECVCCWILKSSLPSLRTVSRALVRAPGS